MLYYDKNLKKLNTEEYCILVSDLDYKISKRTMFKISKDRCITISSVWLGLDHGWNSEKPIVFETMLFGHTELLNADLFCSGEYQDRFLSEAEMISDHKKLCGKIKKQLKVKKIKFKYFDDKKNIIDMHLKAKNA